MPTHPVIFLGSSPSILTAVLYTKTANNNPKLVLLPHNDFNYKNYQLIVGLPDCSKEKFRNDTLKQLERFDVEIDRQYFSSEDENGHVGNETSPDIKTSPDNENSPKKESSPDNENSPKKESSPDNENSHVNQSTPDNENSPKKESTPDNENSHVNQSTPKKQSSPDKQSNPKNQSTPQNHVIPESDTKKITDTKENKSEPEIIFDGSHFSVDGTKSLILITDCHTFSRKCFDKLKNDQNITCKCNFLENDQSKRFKSSTLPLFIIDCQIEEAILSIGEGCRNGMKCNWLIEKMSHSNDQKK
ncbi:Thioredoxin reductase [Pseudoloma neurophilia]|uniref:Thioredoxin reductase n=1 Tax=Pseudoloma neurophilia TaxID=146866 RepID=A0A0R0LXZ8_9MICR|nr:Thioredoxin reductase [Pseudoloma neurophilia]